MSTRRRDSSSPAPCRWRSSPGLCCVAPSAMPRGMMLTRCSGSASGEKRGDDARARTREPRPAASPWRPASPRADRRARSCRTPPRSRRAVMLSRPSRVADSAASLTRLARSAPENPGVFSATRCRLTSGASGLPLACTARIALRAASSGRSTRTRRSKRPGRSSAGSSTSGRLVAAMTTTRSVRSKPSISDSSWFSVCSRSSLPPPRPAPRARPTASISSMNTMAGALFLAS